MKSAKLKPIESDDAGPWKHAPRPKVESLNSNWDFYMHRRRSWDWPSYGWLCKRCSHGVEDHYRGLCESCKHECDGADALHDELLPLRNDVARIYAKHANKRQSR